MSELLGRVEVAAGAASACRPWTKADTHGTSTRAVLHNFNLNIFEEKIGCPCVKKCTKFLVLLMFCQPWPADPTKADTHGTSNGAVLHNFNLNNDCNSCVKDVQSVRRSSCQVFTRFYLQTWPAESAVQT